MDIGYSVAGLFVGVVVGFSGIGGSVILAPVLILLLGVKPSIAVGTDLLYSVPTKILAAVLHHRQGTVDWRIARRLLAGGVGGALVGLALFAIVRARFDPALVSQLVRHAIGVAILVACAGMIWTFFVRRPRADVPSADLTEATVPRRGVVVAIGALVGFLVSLTSVGSGSVTLPLLALALPGFSLRRLIGAEIAFAAMLVPLAALGHVSFGDVAWPAVAALLIGSLPGVWLGSRLARVSGDAWLRPVVICVLAFAGSRLV